MNRGFKAVLWFWAVLLFFVGLGFAVSSPLVILKLAAVIVTLALLSAMIFFLFEEDR